MGHAVEHSQSYKMIHKKEVYSLFLQQLDEKIHIFQSNMDDLSHSIMNETKSTAGDKHETALAMLQREQSHVSKQLQLVIAQKKVLTQLALYQQGEWITRGSLVKTSMGYFYVGVAMPKVTIERATVIGISSESPLGMALLGKKIGEHIMVNGQKHAIETIW